MVPIHQSVGMSLRHTIHTINQFHELVKQGLTQQKASAQAGFGVESIRSAAIRLRIPWLERSSLEKTLLARAEEFQSSSRTQNERAFYCPLPPLSTVAITVEAS